MQRRPPSTSATALAGLLFVAGAAHFVVPRPYERIVPQVFGDAAFWVRWSGVAEIVCAGLVAHPRTRRLGAAGTAALFVSVFPANVQMALHGDIAYGLAWARLPLQIPLVWWALRIARPPADICEGLCGPGGQNPS
jgi:uncharacterized membrane protein